jgi:sigma-B regulation protein RsbU (phosphoserine phosphatase)
MKSTAMTEITENSRIGELELRVSNLSKLVDINNIINSTLDIRRLLTIIMENIKDIMTAEASALLLFEETTSELVFKVALGGAGDVLTEKYRVSLGQGIAGWVARELKPLIVNDAYGDERFDPNFDKSTGFVTRAIICSPLLFKGKLLGVIQAINPIGRGGFSDDDMSLFRIFSEQAALAVQNAMFFQNAIEEERIKIELNSARSISDSMAPDISEVFSGIEVSIKSLPAREMGGAFHGLCRLAGGSPGFALGDVHKKGLPGGLGAASVSGVIRGLFSLKGENPAALMKSIRDMASDSFDLINAMTLFIGRIDAGGREIVYANAGKAYPILIRGGAASYIRIGIRSLKDTDADIKRVRLRLRPGDVFIVVTDGLLNIKNRNGQVMGLKRLMVHLEGVSASAVDIVKSIISFSEKFSGGLERREDIGIMAIKATGLEGR